MKHALARGESAVQDAIVAALAEYCYASRMRFRHTLPYANQQGFDPNKVCADMAAVLSDSILLVLEIKAAHVLGPQPVLDAFKERQLQEYQYLEDSLKLPVHYAFNTVEILAHAAPGPFSLTLHTQTLDQIGLAKPSALNQQGQVAKVAYTLLTYLQFMQSKVAGAAGKKPGAEDAAVRLLGLLERRPLSNSALVLAFAPDASLLMLSTAQLRQLRLQMEAAPQAIDSKQFPRIFKYLKAVEAQNLIKKQEKEAEEERKKNMGTLPGVN